MVSVLLAIAFDGNSQVVENFDDGEFTSNPTWQGDNTKFTVENLILRLQAPAESGEAFLSTPSLSINDAQWKFYLKMEFNPSGSNYAKIYLASDKANLSAELNGYFVLIGDTEDEISLYKQAGNVETKIIDGTDGSVSLSSVEAVIKVTRSYAGDWELLADVGNTGSFLSQGTTTDNTFDASNFFGISCVYTSTRSDKFYFDDFLVEGDPYVDNTPPQLDAEDVLTSNKLILHFNEEISSSSAVDVSHYIVGNGIGNPATATLLPDQKSVELIFTSNFENGIIHTIQVSGIEDLAGNTLSFITKTFLYFVATPTLPKDIIISEIMADPNPQVGLPDAEYIEIYNRSTNPIDLNGWTFSDGNSLATFTFKIVLPGEYYVVTSSTSSSKFGMTANVIDVANFPTLNNSTDTLTLKTPGGILVDSLNYNLSWYQSADKQEGGWSLEIIDLENICGEEDNWTSSEDDSGGTPGLINSVKANKPDLTGPQLKSIVIIDEKKLLLQFNEKLESPISSLVSFSISPEVGVTGYHFETKALRSIILDLGSELVTKQLYKITVNDLADCSGNIISADHNSFEFALPELAEPGDILINEILFNPRPNGVDFVELYNRSDKYFDLKHWSLSNFKEEKIENSKTITTDGLLIAPGTYLAVTTDQMVLKDHYPFGREERFYEAVLPSLPDDLGSVAIISKEGIVIDNFTYDKNFHSPLIKNEEGVSLERISFSEETNNKNNWTSASAVSGFATPGYSNSNLRPESKITAGAVSIEPIVFSPNRSGLNFAQINFSFDQTGLIANVKIIDQQGRLIKTIANNETLGHEGFYKWDGDKDDGGRARAGYYIVWFEVFDAMGLLRTFRERVIIAIR